MDIYAEKQLIFDGVHLFADISTRAGRMAVRAWALTFRVDAHDKAEGEDIYRKLIALVGEDESRYASHLSER